jgi:hypothetical protein
MEHSWHFDESQFSTTLMLQKPESGGIFQLTQPVRGVVATKSESKDPVNSFFFFVSVDRRRPPLPQVMWIG